LILASQAEYLQALKLLSGRSLVASGGETAGFGLVCPCSLRSFHSRRVAQLRWTGRIVRNAGQCQRDINNLLIV
jgi:hypothetical protein